MATTPSSRVSRQHEDSKTEMPHKYTYPPLVSLQYQPFLQSFADESPFVSHAILVVQGYTCRHCHKQMGRRTLICFSVWVSHRVK